MNIDRNTRFDRASVEGATSALAGALPGAAIGFAAHGNLGALLGSMVSIAAWPSVKAFVIDLLEWLFGGVRHRFGIPYVAPSPYRQADFALDARGTSVPPDSAEISVTKVPTALN